MNTLLGQLGEPASVRLCRRVTTTTDHEILFHLRAQYEVRESKKILVLVRPCAALIPV